MPRVSYEEIEKRKAEQAERGPTRVIVVNGRSKFWNGARITYENICEIVGHAQPTVTVSYRKHALPACSLAPGQAAAVEHGMVINALDTGNG